MSSTVGDEGQGGQFGAKEVRTRRLPLAAIFHTYIHTLMAVAALQGADQHIRSILGFSNLLVTPTCRLGELNQ